MEAFRKNVLKEESAEERAKAMYNMGKKDGLAGEGKDQRSHIRNDSDYTKGYSAGVAERKKKDSKKTNEAKGSTAGEGMPLIRAVDHAMKYAAKKRLNLGYAQKVRLRDWIKANVVEKNLSDPVARKAIQDAIDDKEAYR